MTKRDLVFDASALIFAEPIFDFIVMQYDVKISPLISAETGISEGVSVISLEPDDVVFVCELLRRFFGKDSSIRYKKGYKLKHAGEAEALALAKRYHAPVVLHEKNPVLWAKMYKIESIELVDLPDRLNPIPTSNAIRFYELLCKQRSSNKACKKLAELRNPNRNRKKSKKW